MENDHSKKLVIFYVHVCFHRRFYLSLDMVSLYLLLGLYLLSLGFLPDHHKPQERKK